MIKKNQEDQQQLLVHYVVDLAELVLMNLQQRNSNNNKGQNVVVDVENFNHDLIKYLN